MNVCHQLLNTRSVFSIQSLLSVLKRQIQQAICEVIFLFFFFFYIYEFQEIHSEKDLPVDNIEIQIPK